MASDSRRGDREASKCTNVQAWTRLMRKDTQQILYMGLDSGIQKLNAAATTSDRQFAAFILGDGYCGLNDFYPTFLLIFSPSIRPF